MATKNSEAEKRHAELRANRRALEAEMAVIDGQIRDAINNGDLTSLDTLTTRRGALPKLFIAASTAETMARREVFNAQDEANLERLKIAEAKRDKLQAGLKKREAEVEIEFTKMKAEIEEVAGQVSEAYNAITASRDLGASGDAGFKKSLAAVPA